jgi:hypothetical protein
MFFYRISGLSGTGESASSRFRIKWVTENDFRQLALLVAHLFVQFAAFFALATNLGGDLISHFWGNGFQTVTQMSGKSWPWTFSQAKPDGGANDQ